jgi:hypothetical protein
MVALLDFSISIAGIVIGAFFVMMDNLKISE